MVRKMVDDGDGNANNDADVDVGYLVLTISWPLVSCSLAASSSAPLK